MLKEADVNTTADGIDKLGTNTVSLLHLPHGCNCKLLTYKTQKYSKFCRWLFTDALRSRAMPQSILSIFVQEAEYLTICRSFFLKANDL